MKEILTATDPANSTAITVKLLFVSIIKQPAFDATVVTKQNTAIFTISSYLEREERKNWKVVHMIRMKTFDR